MKGFIHIYCGDGKGKSTAAIGLAVRAAGSGIPVLFVQFMKSDTSGEVAVLRSIKAVETMHAKKQQGFFVQMTEDEKQKAKEMYSDLLKAALEKIKTMVNRKKTDDDSAICGLIILDEIISAYEYELVDRKILMDFLKQRAHGLEVVLTGRNPAAELQECADYITHMKKVKHPFDQGITARKGIEL